MFCPEGFTSLAELWNKFLKERIRDRYSDSAQNYHSPKFNPSFSRGSPLDICEHVFLRSISFVGPYLAAPNGQVMKVHAPLEDGLVSMFSVASYQYSTGYSKTAVNEGGEINLVEKIAGSGFQAYDGAHKDVSWWRKRYPLRPKHIKTDAEWELPHLSYHTLPLCFEPSVLWRHGGI